MTGQWDHCVFDESWQATATDERDVTLYELAREAEAAKLRIECVASDLLALADLIEVRDPSSLDWVAGQLRRKAEELVG